MLKHEAWFVQKLNMTFYDILTFRRRRHGFDLQCQASTESKGVSQVFWEEKHWQKSRTTMRSSKRHDNLLCRSLTGKLVADGVNVILVGFEHVGGPPFKVGRNIHLKNHLWKERNMIFWTPKGKNDVVVVLFIVRFISRISIEHLLDLSEDVLRLRQKTTGDRPVVFSEWVFHEMWNFERT